MKRFLGLHYRHDHYAKGFSPTWYMSLPFLQTCVPKLFPFRCDMDPRLFDLQLPDGDFVEIAHYEMPERPILILLTGSESNHDAHAVQCLVQEFVNYDWQVVVMHHRCCGFKLNRLPESYHALQTKDLTFLIDFLVEQYPGIPLVAAGISLGANVLIHYAIQNPVNPLLSVGALSLPFDWRETIQNIPPLYERWLLRGLKDKVKKKIQRGDDLPISLEQLSKIKDVYSFDDKLVAPLHDFSGANDYYTQASVGDILHGIETPALIINAEDDPFVPHWTLPEVRHLPSCVELVVTKRGGHAGFKEGVRLKGLDYWPASLLRRYFDSSLAES